MKLIGIEVPDGAKAITVTVLTPDEKNRRISYDNKMN